MFPASEDDILALVNRHFPEDHPSLSLGRGDDCAVMLPRGPLAVSTDIFAEDAHFRRSYFTPYDIGWKSLAVNVSDIGSSGTVPTGFSIGLTLTGKEDIDWISQFCEGMSDLSLRFDLAISGGDLARSSLLNICITAWGELPSALPLGLRRGVAQEGDVLFISGRLGLARLGLTVLENAVRKGADQEKKQWPDACSQHLRPMPLAMEGRTLGDFAVKKGLQDRIGLMDVSDGLARDLPRLLASQKSGLGADICICEEDIHPEIRLWCQEKGHDAAAFVFEGGEDYALAGTCPREHWEDIAELLSTFSVPFLRLGTVKKGNITLNGKGLLSSGFDHFVS